ncbi:TPA: PefC/AfrB family outer membrane usher protein [Photobacterium damselae]
MVKIRFTLSGICLALVSCGAVSSEFNLDFLKGTKVAPSILNADVLFPAGMYDVDVWLNGKMVGQQALSISLKEEKDNRLCLSPNWLSRAGILILPSFYDSVFDASRQCYELSQEGNTSLTFNPSKQHLTVQIPQAYLPSDESQLPWNYGESGVRLQYDGNFNVSSENVFNVFGQAELGVNVKQWRLDGNFNASRSEQGGTISSNKLVVTTPIRQLTGDFAFGRNQTDMNLFSDFGFYGASLRSNIEMIPWKAQGYAPVISGIANSTSRISVSQDGYIIYSKVVPPGPYEFSDINPVGNGDLTVTVKEEDGAENVTVYPVATLPSLLRPDESRYNFVIGRKTNSSELKNAFLSDDGLFALGSLDYGFNDFTLSSASILHEKYQSLGFGVTRSFGEWGALNADVAVASAHYDNDDNDEGYSLGFKYAKSFSSRTDLQLLAYRYQSSGYVEFAEFDASDKDKDRFFTQRRSRYEARLSHRFDDVYVRAAFWSQDYWQTNGRDIGGSFSFGTQWQNRYPIYVNGSYTDTVLTNNPDYAVTMSVSIPFSFDDIEHYSFNSMGYSKYSGLNVNTGVSASVNERLNYSLSANADKNTQGASASIGYSFDSVQTNIALSQNSHVTSLSGGVSGSVIATQKTGLLFTGENADTLAVVKLNGIEGVTFNDSLPTDEQGITVVRLNNYADNTININTRNVPDDIELARTSFSTVPTEHALLYQGFEVQQVLRYILRLKDAQGHVLTDGNAITQNGEYAGFVADNGVLLLSLNQKPNEIIINRTSSSCRIDMTQVQTAKTTLQEVVCE